jgi:hypothetical protein
MDRCVWGEFSPGLRFYERGDQMLAAEDLVAAAVREERETAA